MKTGGAGFIWQKLLSTKLYQCTWTKKFDAESSLKVDRVCNAADLGCVQLACYYGCYTSSQFLPAMLTAK